MACAALRIVLICLWMTLAANAEGECVENPEWKFNPATQKCYFFNAQEGNGIGLTWRGARNWCMANGGDLVSLHGKDEVDFLISVWPENTDYWDWWIGLNELDLSGGYTWSDGSPVNFKYWASGEPNDYYGHELCVEMRYARGRILKGQWNDQVCSFIRGFICMKNPGGAVNPPTIRPPPIPGNCPPSFLPFGNKCYNFVPIKKTWEEAQKHCQGLGNTGSKSVNLASIADETEQAFITSQMINRPFSFWVGLRQLAREPSDRNRGKFFWIDNSDLGYTNWNRGEPNGGPDQNICVHIYDHAFRAGEWNDDYCDNQKFFICSANKNPSYPPLPTLPNPCGQGNYAYGPGCYFLIPVQNTWQQAQDTCQQTQGYQLASVNSQYEQGFVRALMKTNNMIFEDISLWIGLTDRQDPGHYEWADKWPVVYTNWGDGQPMKDEGGCIGVTSKDGKWYDWDCTVQNAALCKKSSERPPYKPFRYGQCPSTQSGDDWVGHDDQCYLFKTKETLSHGDSEVACTARDASLVSVHSEQEQTFLTSRLSNTVSHTVWLGLMRTLTRGFQWKDDTVTQYTNWGQGAPSDVDGTLDKNCVEMFASGKWWDVQCQASRGYICKRQQVNSKKPLPGPAIAGIVIAVSIVVLGALVAVYFVWKKKFSGGIASYFDKRPTGPGFSPSDVEVPDKTGLSTA